MVVSPSFVWLQPLWWWQMHLIQLPLNEQRETTSLRSFPFVRCIHSDYITWLSKWLCMHIIPSFLVDKASCTRQFESELSLHSLASLFPIKEGIFSNSSVSLSKGSSTSNQAFLLRRKDVTALLGARNRYVLRLADHQRSSPGFAGWDRQRNITTYKRNMLEILLSYCCDKF